MCNAKSLKLCSFTDQIEFMLGKSITTANVITVLIIGIISACNPEVVPDSTIPEIELRSVEIIDNVAGKDSVITVELFYSDGDGDIGLTDSDTAPQFNFGSPFFHNLPVTYLVENSMGEYEELKKPGSNEPYRNEHERVPNLTPEGKFKAIEGVLYVDLLANPQNTRPEKLKLEINLIDRDLNISNQVTTPIMILEH